LGAIAKAAILAHLIAALVKGLNGRATRQRRFDRRDNPNHDRHTENQGFHDALRCFNAASILSITDLM
jgi:hypothetical protein